MNKFLDILGKIKLNWILLAGCVIFALLFLRQCDIIKKVKQETLVVVSNYETLEDSVRIISNKLGDEVAVKRTLLTNKKDLEDLNADLSKEVNALKGRVISLQTAQVKVERDTIYLDNTLTVIENPDSSKTYSLDWVSSEVFDENNSRILEGVSEFSIDSSGILYAGQTIITMDELNMAITTGVQENKDGKFEIFIKTDYPGVSFTDINGAILDDRLYINKESSWVFGPSIGTGIGVVNNFGGTTTLGAGIFFGFSFTYNLNKQFKKLKLK